MTKLVFQREEAPRDIQGFAANHAVNLFRLRDGRVVVVSLEASCANPGKWIGDLAREIAYDEERKR
jgi:hypothetical protein